MPSGTPKRVWTNAPVQAAEKLDSALAFAWRSGLPAVVLAFGWRSGSPALHLLLGGAAVHRCDNYIVLNAASAAEVYSF
jgi:hypothetical protein